MESVHTAETERQPTVAENLFATIKTNLGDITVRLFPDYAPKTVANFVGLAEGTKEWTHPETQVKSTTPLYDGTIFHRVIPGFMIQGGDPLGQGFGGPGYVFDDEPHPDQTFNDRDYLLAMANAGIRGGRGTNGSQFFITVPSGRRPTHLNGKHTIFGEVVDDAGRKVVDAIASVPTGAQDRPQQPVVIESITVERREG
jgi:peptidyl-prolyl cis-trans isomerase A (cyclophilin A)